MNIKCPGCGTLLQVTEGSTESICPCCNTRFSIAPSMPSNENIETLNTENNASGFENTNTEAPKMDVNKKILAIKIIAWILFLPFMATYYIIKSEKLDKKKKIIFSSVVWGIVLISALVIYIISIPKEPKAIIDVTNPKEKANAYASDDAINEFFINFKKTSAMEVEDIVRISDIKYSAYIHDVKVEISHIEVEDYYLELTIYANGSSEASMLQMINVYKEILKSLDKKLDNKTINKSVEENINGVNTDKKYIVQKNIEGHYYPKTKTTDPKIEINILHF